MTTDEALRRIDVENREIRQVEEKNKELRDALKKNGISFADLSARVMDTYMVTEPLLKLYAEGRRSQAILSENVYLEWMMQENQVDANGNMEDKRKEEEEKMMEEILRCM